MTSPGPQGPSGGANGAGGGHVSGDLTNAGAVHVRGSLAVHGKPTGKPKPAKPMVRKPATKKDER